MQKSLLTGRLCRYQAKKKLRAASRCLPGLVEVAVGAIFRRDSNEEGSHDGDIAASAVVSSCSGDRTWRDRNVPRKLRQRKLHYQCSKRSVLGKAWLLTHYTELHSVSLTLTFALTK